MEHNVALLIFGVLLLLVGLIGAVKAKELEVGTNSKLVRIVLTIIGAGFIFATFNPGIVESLVTDSENNVNQSNHQQEELNFEPESDPVTDPEPEPIINPEMGFEGEFRIQVASTNYFLHMDGMGDKLLSIRAQENDDYTRFIFEREADNSYRIKVKANDKYLHEDGWGDKLLSIRAEESDDFTRFLIEVNEDGSIRFKTKATNRYWHIDTDGDLLVSTRFQNELDQTRFFLRKE